MLVAVDVALLKRLRNSEEWLRRLCVDLLRENGIALLKRLRIVDGTIVKEPGKTGSQWRILYSLHLPALNCDFFEIGATEGEGTGESFRRLPIVPQELVLGDAGYWSTAGIEFVRSRKADVLVRVNPQSFVAYGPQGRRVGLLRRLRTIRQAGEIGEWKVVLRGEDASVEGRVCVIRKSELSIQQAHRCLQRKASKKQTTLKPENRGVSLAQVTVELNLFLVGWINYYRYAACRFDLQCLDEWIRRKLRCYRLKQRKHGKSLAGFLQQLGASPSLAHRLASSGKGWWRLSLARPVHQAMSKDWFATQGLTSLVDKYDALQH